MYLIDWVTIENFWGYKDIEINFHDDVNFLIGVNGSGKTTLINLIVAALTANFHALRVGDFSKITIKLKSLSSAKKPVLEILKKYYDNNSFDDIEYRIRATTSEQPKVYSINLIHQQRREVPKYILRREFERLHRDSIVAGLSKLVNISWLSVNRSNSNKESSTTRNLSSVDKKLYELNNSLVRFFSELDNVDLSISTNFQKKIFLSLLINEDYKAATKKDTHSKKIQQDRDTLLSIFDYFKINEPRVQSMLDKHMGLLTDAYQKWFSNDELSFVNIASIISSGITNKIIDEWKIAEEERKTINEPKQDFIDLLNKLMQRKNFSINERNELFIDTATHKNLSLDDLSSGEKQLLIILGEALLQRRTTGVFIADEPELSLHVTWQESLVDNLRILNPKSQIIFATHSPDIVSRYGDNIFDMEKVLS